MVSSGPDRESWDEFDSRSLPVEYSLLLKSICEFVSNNAFKDRNNDDDIWDGSIFQDFLDTMYALPHIRFRQLLDKKGISYKNNFKKIRSQGIGPDTAEKAFCLSAKAQGIPLVLFLQQFVQYCLDESIHLEGFNGHESAITSLLSKQLGNRVSLDRKSLRKLAPTIEQPRLDPPASNTSIHYYGSEERLDIMGREKEQERLEDFLKCDMPFAWFQLAGVGGQGKSRLALDFWLKAEQKGWAAGLLDRKSAKVFQDKWNDWQPDRPHLIVVDYVAGKESITKPMIQTLAARCGELRECVRLLLIERQRWDKGEFERDEKPHMGQGQHYILNSSHSHSYARWYLNLTESDQNDGRDRDLNQCRFDTGVEELLELDQGMLVDIVRRVAKKVGPVKTLPQSDEDIEKQLAHIDPSGRPLYAHFLGQQLASDPQSEFSTRNDLLTSVLEREYYSRWKNIWGNVFEGDAPIFGDDLPAMRIAVISTITKELNCIQAQQHSAVNINGNAVINQALVINDGPRGENPFPDKTVPGMQA